VKQREHDELAAQLNLLEGQIGDKDREIEGLRVTSERLRKEKREIEEKRIKRENELQE
jgi:hypothetical protein